MLRAGILQIFIVYRGTKKTLQYYHKNLWCFRYMSSVQLLKSHVLSIHKSVLMIKSGSVICQS
jgi:hypothetical protein